MARMESNSGLGRILKIVVSLAAIGVGIFLVFGPTSEPVADAVFVGAIALALAIYLWLGVTKGQARIIAVVLALVAAYAFVRGFGLFQLSTLRQIGGITAIVSGVILVLPFVRSLIARPQVDAD